VKLDSDVNRLINVQILQPEQSFAETYTEYNIAVPSVEFAMQILCNWDYTGAHNAPDVQPSGTTF
jgi:hypothetical protein